VRTLHGVAEQHLERHRVRELRALPESTVLLVEPSEELVAVVRKFAGRVPQVAAAFGVEPATAPPRKRAPRKVAPRKQVPPPPSIAEAPPAFLKYLRFLCVADGNKAKEKMGFRAAYTTREALIDFTSAQRLRDVKLLQETPA
jgi:hypothetical protein